MTLVLSFHHRMSGQADVQPAPPMPMVYEDVPLRPARWEYQVLTIDVREQDLPDADVLNRLGKEGWLLISVVEQHRQASTSLVHYYFVRLKMD